MSKLKLKRPSLGTILGFTALVVAVAGNAGASPHRTVRRGDIAPEAVTAKALANGSVTSKKLAKHAVTARKLHEGAGHDGIARACRGDGRGDRAGLGPRRGPWEDTVHATPIPDRDQIAANPEWTASNSERVLCAPGERLLSPGFGFTNIGNREATFLQVLPSASANGVLGLMATNSGGTAAGEIEAFCLK